MRVRLELAVACRFCHENWAANPNNIRPVARDMTNDFIRNIGVEADAGDAVVPLLSIAQFDLANWRLFGAN